MEINNIKKELGLSGLKYIYFQKLLGGFSTPIYLITFNTRYPKMFLSVVKVLQQKALSLEKIKKMGVSTLLRKKWRLTPPRRLETITKVDDLSKALIIMNDMAGENYHDPKAFNESMIKYNIRYI